MLVPNPYTLAVERMIGGATKLFKIEGDYTAASDAASFSLIRYLDQGNSPLFTKNMTVDDGSVELELTQNDTIGLEGKYIYQVTVSNASGRYDVEQGVLFIHRNINGSGITPPSATSIQISYSTAHGTAPSNKIVYVWSGSSYPLRAEDLPTLTATGYRFLGWNKVVGDTISSNTTLTAQWEEIQYTSIVLSYVSAHGTTPANKTRSFEVGGSYTLRAEDLPALSEEGYVFSGWDKAIGTTVTQNTVITASWTTEEHETVYYGVAVPASKNDLPNFNNLTVAGFVSGSAFQFTTNAGTGAYSYFAYPTALGSAGFRYMFPDEGSWWSGGYTSLGTTTRDGISYTVYRSTNANLGAMTTSVTIT